jgi:hypothetical protein
VLAMGPRDIFPPDLVFSLGNLSVRLSDLGHHEEAPKANKEAVRIYRPLAAARPDVFHPDLARTLGNLSIRLLKLGYHDGVLKQIRKPSAFIIR